MKRLLLVCLMILCIFVRTVSFADRIATGLPVEPFGEVPEAFAEIVSQNLFGELDYSCIGWKLFNINYDDDDTMIINRLDNMGHPVASCTIDRDGMKLCRVLGTSDGGFLAALGHIDVRDKESILSKLIKYSSSAEIEWVCLLEGVNAPMLQYFFETDEGYCIIGNWEYPETKEPGTFSPAGVGYMVISPAGHWTDTRVLGGSRIDMLLNARETEDGYLLIVQALSKDGDFSPWVETAQGIPYICATVDKSFHLIDATLLAEDEALALTGSSIGIIDGIPVYDGEGILDAYEPGVPILAVDYDDCYLIVSYQYLETEEEDWIIETIYSAYDKAGTLLWRATSQRIEDWSEEDWDWDEEDSDEEEY